MTNGRKIWSMHCNNCGHNETLPLDLDQIPTDETVAINRYDAGMNCRVCKSSDIDLKDEGEVGGEA